MSWRRNPEARAELLALMRRFGRPVGVTALKRELRKSSGATLQLLYSLETDGCVEREKKLGLWVWRLTGEPLPMSSTSTTDVKKRQLKHSVYDHRALAAALKHCVTPPPTPAHVRIHICGGA